MEKKRYVIPTMEIVIVQTESSILTISGVTSDIGLPFTGGGNGFSRAPGLFGVSGFDRGFDNE